LEVHGQAGICMVGSTLPSKNLLAPFQRKLPSLPSNWYRWKARLIQNPQMSWLPSLSISPMSTNPLFYILQDPPPSSPTAQLKPHPAVYLVTYSYNPEWGQAQQVAFLHNVIQTSNKQPSTSGPAPTTDDDRYQCKWLVSGIPCHQRFANFDELMIHMGGEHDVQGSSDRKLDCEWFTSGRACGKKCRRDGIRRHIGTHVGDSVPCTHCDKSFSRSDSMRAHVKRHHNKK